VLPFVIHRDQAVPEALARQRPVLETAPSSQSALDLRRAAEWVMETLGADRPHVAAPVERDDGGGNAGVPAATGAG